MKKVYYTLLALLVCLGFFGAALGSIWNDSLTSDEVSHIPAGYYYLTEGKHFINPEHPPLTKDLAALPLLILSPTKPEITGNISEPTREEPAYPYPEEINFLQSSEIDNSQWEWGRLFLFNSDNDPNKLTFWARFSIILFNSILLFILFITLKSAWNPRAALISLFLIAVSPFMLAHASLVTLDFMPSLFMIIGLGWWAVYLKKWGKQKGRALPFTLAMLFFSFAMLSKFSFLIVLPVALLAGLIFAIIIKKKFKHVLFYLLRFGFLCVLILMIITIFYAPHVMNMETDAMQAQWDKFYPNELSRTGYNIGSILISTDNAGLKGITEYALGVGMVFARVQGASQTIFFLGNVYGSEGAGLLYFPLLFLTKLSLAFIILLFFVLGIWIWQLFKVKIKFKERIKKYFSDPLSFILWISIIVYLAVTLTSDFQIGLRHIMPIIFAAIILVAKGVDLWWYLRIFKKIKFSYISLALGILMLITAAWVFPHYLSYYNFLGGGTNKGYIIATDSNYDWGQDIVRLQDWMSENNKTEIYTDLFSNVPLKYYLGEEQKDFKIEDKKAPPSGSLVAISINEYQNDPNKDKWEDFKIDKIGKTILIFEMP